MTPPRDELVGYLAFAHALADLADAITLPGFRADPDVERKADGTAVTVHDRGTERALRHAVQERFPAHAFLGEEDGLEGLEDAPTWVVDPIDGTANFIRGNPVWATLVALCIGGDEVVGVVSAPALGSRWDGVAGGPAHQDGHAIRVASTSELGAAQVSFGGLGYFDAAGLSGVVADLAARTHRQRGFGDFWQHCLVASGACDLAVEAEVNRWDLAAVKVVVEAAGGRFTDLRGNATADGGDALSSNGLLHDEVLALIDAHRGAAAR